MVIDRINRAIVTMVAAPDPVNRLAARLVARGTESQSLRCSNTLRRSIAPRSCALAAFELLSASLLMLIACSSSSPPPAGKPGAAAAGTEQARPTVAAPSMPQANSARASDDWGYAFGLEWAEADTIEVETLQAITVEANEILCADIERTRHYPTSKNSRWLRLEGHEIVGGTLIAHHVRAQRVRAKRIVAHRIIRSSRPYRWSSGREEPARVRNRLMHVVDGVAREVVP